MLFNPLYNWVYFIYFYYLSLEWFLFIGFTVFCSQVQSLLVYNSFRWLYLRFCSIIMIRFIIFLFLLSCFCSQFGLDLLVSLTPIRTASLVLLPLLYRLYLQLLQTSSLWFELSQKETVRWKRPLQVIQWPIIEPDHPRKRQSGGKGPFRSSSDPL